MDEPVEVQNTHVETTSQTPPPVVPSAAPVVPSAAPAYVAPVAAPVAQRVVSTSSSTSAVVPAAFRAQEGVWLVLAVVDVILALRFLFYALGANNVGFASVMYGIGSALDAPFRGIFSTTVDPSGHPLQWADLLAIAVYILAAWVVNKVILISSTRNRSLPAA